MEPKQFTLKFEEGKLIVTGDMNQDGQPSISLVVDLTEVADEVISHFRK